MKKKNVLSLHEETEKEAAKIEKEILKDSKLEEIKVSDEMEKRLAEQIQAYEKTQSQKKVHRHSPLFRRRVMVAAAVLMIAVVATSVTAVGSKSYLKEIIEKRHLPLIRTAIKMVTKNEYDIMITTEEEQKAGNLHNLAAEKPAESIYPAVCPHRAGGCAVYGGAVGQ